MRQMYYTNIYYKEINNNKHETDSKNIINLKRRKNFNFNDFQKQNLNLIFKTTRSL